jgi:hypothetical protein
MLAAYVRLARKLAQTADSDAGVKDKLRKISNILQEPVAEIFGIDQMRRSERYRTSLSARLENVQPDNTDDADTEHVENSDHTRAAAEARERISARSETQVVEQAPHWEPKDTATARHLIESLAAMGVSPPEIAGYKMNLEELLAKYGSTREGSQKSDAFHALHDFTDGLADRLAGNSPTSSERARRRADRVRLSVEPPTEVASGTSPQIEPVPDAASRYDFTEFDARIATLLKHKDGRLVKAVSSLAAERSALGRDIDAGTFIGDPTEDIRILEDSARSLEKFGIPVRGPEPVFTASGLYMPKRKIPGGWEFSIPVSELRPSVPPLNREKYFKTFSTAGTLAEAIKYLNAQLLSRPVANPESFVDPEEEYQRTLHADQAPLTNLVNAVGKLLARAFRR